MSRRLRRFATALCATLLITLFAASAQEPQSPLQGADEPLTEPEPESVDQWLAEVRAQRHAREERRRAAKEAMDARRRWIDPWGAAQKEAREQETQRRRDAFFEHIERDRETLRNQVPWRFLYDPWTDGTAGSPLQMPSSSDADTPEIAGQAGPHTSPYQPPHWDNRWYYRGF